MVAADRQWLAIGERDRVGNELAYPELVRGKRPERLIEDSTTPFAAVVLDYKRDRGGGGYA